MAKTDKPTIERKTPITKKANLDGDSEVAQFMLAELEYTRGQFRIFMNRFENLLTFYLTALGAIVSAIAVFLTSSLITSIQSASLALLAGFAWGFSLVIFARLCITRSMMVLHMARERNLQEYFLTRHNHLSKYVAPNVGRADLYNWKGWQRMAFARRTLVFFYLMGAFTGLLGVVFSSLAISSLFDALGIPLSMHHLPWYAIFGVIAFIGTWVICLLVLRNQQRKAQEYAEKNLSRLLMRGDEQSENNTLTAKER